MIMNEFQKDLLVHHWISPIQFTYSPCSDLCVRNLRKGLKNEYSKEQIGCPIPTISLSFFPLPRFS
uniref:Uncharacterized protein n=1 Tax=Picea glauca TaxID=3330 RepID=A0A101M341_PICGL|nr:hypothetical protein ABT39_MTgene3297 [Picea glauca]QHR89184.1 hypothetical protein Q903MT_gene3204 [Picea sitchensis]